MADPSFIRPRTALFLVASAVIVSAAAFSSGCGGSDGCDDTLDCSAATGEPTGDPQTGSTSSGMSGTGGGGGNGAGGSGGEGGGVPNCDPISGTVSTTCGVFVSTTKGSDGAAGTKSAPVATLAKALELADSNGKRVYACNESFSEAIVVPAGVTLYGALDCASDWSYTPAKQTNLTADPDQVPMTLAKTGEAQPTRINDFAITSQDATVDGGSSIAVLAVNVTAEFTSCAIVSGRGANGAEGEAPQSLASAAKGGPGKAGCVAPPNDGGVGGQSTCVGDVDNSGGDGGDGRKNLSASGAGQPGIPQPRGTSPKDGHGGQGFVSLAMPCEKGDDGDPGTSGMGAAAIHDIGHLDVGGYFGPAPVDGLVRGTNGQGGGGGGGGDICSATQPGASGGGGGGGGCGGEVGKGGQSGGSSIGVLSFGSQIGFHGGSVTAGVGGAGGKGGAGQVGATGGRGGDPNGDSCAGGDGGRGGNGGAGAGGIGGHSIAVAVVGAVPTLSNSPALTTSAKGVGAEGGDASVGKSDDGKACQVLDFNDPSGSCP